MKKLIVLSVLSFNLSAMDIQPSHSGAWYNPDQSGHGLSVEVLDDGEVIVFWYTFDHDGKPMWLLGQGQSVGNRVVLDTYHVDGMVFGEWNVSEKNEKHWGTMTLDFQNCDEVTFSYNGQGYGNGSIPMVRISDIDNLKCSNNLMTGTYKVTLATSDDYPDYGIGWATLMPNGKAVGFIESTHNLAVFSGSFTRNDEGDMTFTAAGFDYGGGTTPSETSNGRGGSGGFWVEDQYGTELQGSRSSEATFSEPVFSKVQKLGYKDFYFVDIRSEQTGVLTLDGNNVSGSFYGCQIEGELSQFHAKFDITALSLELKECDKSGHYEGASFLDGLVVLENGNEGLVWAAYAAN